MKTAKKVTMAQYPWDLGPQTAAQSANKILEDAAEPDPETGVIHNPNGVMRARRVDMLEVYHRRGWISTRGFVAADRLRRAWLNTQRAPGGYPLRVDTSPKPDQSIDILLSRISTLAALSAHISQDDRAILECIVYHDLALGHLPAFRGRHFRAGVKKMAEALERLADQLEAPRRPNSHGPVDA